MISSMSGAAESGGSARLHPRRSRPNYIVLRTLADLLREETERRLAGGSLEVVDVGCGDRPYAPLVQPHARRYVGVDIAAGPHVDIVAPAESLPFDDASFDCVLCTQVLEHSIDPHAVCSEANRILRPGGLALISTHGVTRYHPAPEDYWRWTHAGLRRLLESTGTWDEIAVRPCGRTASAIAHLVNREIQLRAARHRLGRLATPLIYVLNSLALAIDGRPDEHASPPGLAINYLVVSVKGSG
jgi:SAM-dependent methyltransferase